MSTINKLVRHMITYVILCNLPRVLWANCSYRDKIDLPPKVFSIWANWGCYSFNRPDMFDGYALMPSWCNMTIKGEGVYPVPGLIFNDSCAVFSTENEMVKSAVQDSFKYNSTVQRWLDCSMDAMDCCMNVMLNSTLKENHCPAVWDGWSCFNSIASEQTYEQVCSEYAYAGEPPRCHHYSYKDCLSNGKWREKTDYSSCDITPQLKFRTNWHISTLALSILFCTPAALALIVIHTQKLSIVRNLVYTIIIRNLFVILVKAIIIMDEITETENTVMGQNKWPCKFLTFLEKLSGNAVFACMLLEGIYLHQLLTNAFRSRQSGGVKMLPFYIGCGVIAIASAVIWASIMAAYDDQNCWQVTEGTDFSWIITGPRLLMLIINLGLMIHVVWALWNTFHSRDDEDNAAVRTAKATLICLPLFGIPFFFVILHPDTNNCGFEQFYYVVDYSLEALQGVFIVIFHCYRERDVKKIFIWLYDEAKVCWTKKTKKQDNLTDSSMPERRTTMRSDLEHTENRIQRSTNSTVSTPEIRNSNMLSVPSSRFINENSPSRNNGALLDHSIERDNPMFVTEDDAYNTEVNLDPKILFRNRCDDVVLLDPKERKN